MLRAAAIVPSEELWDWLLFRGWRKVSASRPLNLCWRFVSSGHPGGSGGSLRDSIRMHRSTAEEDFDGAAP